MANATRSRETVDQVRDWLVEAGARHGLTKGFRAVHTRTEGQWLHFAVQPGELRDSADRARVLVEIEDEWDAQEPHSDWKLMLLPAAH
jgi:hypothetical protein